MKKIACIFLCSLFANFSSGQGLNNRGLERSLDSLIAAQFKRTEPGLAVLVAKKGQIVYQKAFGTANMELDVPLRTDMVFRIGSISKQFTAVGILRLVEEGKLSLQDSVQKYLKQFPSKGSTITIENLLTHTSGLKEYTAIESNVPFIERHDLSPKMLIDHFKDEPLEFRPGSRYAYSNSGYVLLGAIIEAVSGESFQIYMAKRVLEPAGLRNTYYAKENKIIPGRVVGYTRDNGFYENADYQTLSLGFACGDLLSTVADLYQWNTALLAGKVIKKETLKKAFTPFLLNDGSSADYGYGWFVTKVLGKNCIKHEGQTSGFIGLEFYFPDEDIYVSILTNLKSGEDKTNFSDKRFVLFNEIVSTALGKDGASSLALGAEVLKSYVGRYQSTIGSKIIEVKIKRGELLLVDEMDLKLKALSQSKFSVLNIPVDTTVEFVQDEKGKVVKLIAQQKERVEWRKIE